MLLPLTVSRQRAVAWVLLSRLHVAPRLASVYLRAFCLCRSKHRVIACLCQSVVILPIENNNLDSCVRAATPSWSAQTRVAMDCLAPLPFGNTASRSTFGKTANLKLQQDVRFPFTQLMKTRSKMVEDTIYHQIFTLKHSLTGSETLQCPIGPHGGAHAPTVRKGSWLPWNRVSARLLHGSSVHTASLPSPLPPSIPPSSLPGPTVVKQYHGGRLTTL